MSFALITGCFLFMCFDVNRKLLPRRKTKQRIFRNIFFVDSKIVKTCDELYQKVDVWPLVLRQQSARWQIRSSLCVHFQNLKKSKFHDECVTYTACLTLIYKCEPSLESNFNFSMNVSLKIMKKFNLFVP